MQAKLKKAQHYVFQSYLKAWCNDGKKLWCLKDNNIFESNTHNVAQQRFFYEIEKWSEEEIAFYKIYISDQPLWFQKSLIAHFHEYQYPFEEEERLKKLHDALLCYIRLKGDNALPLEIEENFSDVQKVLDIAKKNMTEDFYSDIEGEATKWIEMLQNKDTSFYKGDEFGDFISFIGLQYFRTKKMSDHFINVLESAKNNKNLVPYWKRYGINPKHIISRHFVHMLAWQYQGALTENLIQKKPHMTLLVNNSPNHFLTSDQPIINIKADYKDVNQTVKELVLYLPISPTIAITINDNNSVDEISIDEFTINQYNKLIVDSSHEFVFGDNEDSLLQWRIVN